MDGLLRLLQLCDASFPTGGYAFSHGIEGLSRQGNLRGEDDLLALLRAQIEESATGLELPALLHAHRLAAAGALSELIDLDSYLSALKPVPAFRAGSIRVGRRFLESASELIDGDLFQAYRSAVRARAAEGHYPVAFGVALQALGVDARMGAVGAGSVFVNGLIAAAVRLGLIGQAAAVRLRATLHPDILLAVERATDVPISDMGAYLPMVDIAGLRQETLPSRLFSS